MPPAEDWDVFLDDALATLHRRHLFRSLRLTYPIVSSSTRVSVTQEDFDRWVGCQGLDSDTRQETTASYVGACNRNNDSRRDARCGNFPKDALTPPGDVPVSFFNTTVAKEKETKTKIYRAFGPSEDNHDVSLVQQHHKQGHHHVPAELESSQGHQSQQWEKRHCVLQRQQWHNNQSESLLQQQERQYHRQDNKNKSHLHQQDYQQTGDTHQDNIITNKHLPPSSNEEDTKTITLYSLNDYLGLSSHAKVREATSLSAQRYGNGPRSSVLVGGYTCYHAALESTLASLKGTETSLLFPTGFAANTSVIAALARDGQIDIFSDELNHASIVDGCRLAARGSKVHVYRHNDAAHLEALLRGCSDATRRKLIITDSLFSMDGDMADIPALVGLKRKYGALLAVDEAHATLVLGSHGGGVVEEQQVDPGDVDLHVGTLSKAVGSIGGFVACSRRWKDFFINMARGQIFSTSLPVPAVVAAQTAIDVASKEPWRRRHVLQLAQRMGTALGMMVCSPIVPVILGGEEETLGAARYLLQERCMHVPAIRPPTVPSGTSRLRVSLSAGHSTADVDALLGALDVYFSREKILGGCGLNRSRI